LQALFRAWGFEKVVCNKTVVPPCEQKQPRMPEFSLLLQPADLFIVRPTELINVTKLQRLFPIVYGSESKLRRQFQLFALLAAAVFQIPMP
jgi:hypothetical protein